MFSFGLRIAKAVLIVAILSFIASIVVLIFNIFTSAINYIITFLNTLFSNISSLGTVGGDLGSCMGYYLHYMSFDTLITSWIGLFLGVFTFWGMSLVSFMAWKTYLKLQDYAIKILS